MASVIVECSLRCPPEQAWALLADVAAPHKAFPNVVTDARMDNGERLITFANGAVVRERIVSINPARRRIAYAGEAGSASTPLPCQVLAEDGGHCRFLWASDFLPDEFAPLVETPMHRGMKALTLALAGQP